MTEIPLILHISPLPLLLDTKRMHMSCLPRCRHFKLVKLPAIISLLVTSQLYAATIGTTHVNSIQYEPLSATIDVSDIDADNFSVALANQQTYQHMGLSARPTMSVSFVRSSPNSGKVVITTSAPLSEPFADVVLTVNDAGSQNIVPKTLLLPLGKGIMPSQSNLTTGNTKTPNLPTVNPSASASLQQPILGKPLPINSSLPPPLNVVSVTPQATNNEPLNAAILADSNIGNSELKDSDTVANDNSKNLQTLTMQVHRSYHARSTRAANNNEQNTDRNQPVILTQEQMLPDSQDNVTEIAATKTETQSEVSIGPVANANNAATAQANNDNKASEAQTASSAPSISDVPNIPLGTQTYTVQRNDNLWTISRQIATENNLSIQTVMQQIKAYNQDAFIDGNVERLKANANLKLPDYEVIPSKLGIQAAIAARKAQQTKPSSSVASSTKNAQKNQRTETAQAKRPAKTTTPTKSTAKAVTRPHVTLVTPNKSTSKSSKAATGTGQDAALVAKLQTTRQLTAQKAKQVQSLSQQFTESTNRMHLQNQRLADLEKRLKNLRNK